MFGQREVFDVEDRHKMLSDAGDPLEKFDGVVGLRTFPQTVVESTEAF